MHPSVPLALWLLASLASSPTSGEGVTYLDGRAVEGRITDLTDGALSVTGLADPVPLYELAALVFGAPEKETDVDPSAGPISVFRDGETLLARVVKAGGRTAQLELHGLRLEVPTEALKAFRLREANTGDDLFETELKNAAAPSRDTVYVRRGTGLLRVEGVFQALDDEFLTLEYEGQARKLRRQLVLGVILAPVASPRAEEGMPALFELRRGGQFPATLVGIRSEGETRLLVRFRGATPGAVVTVNSKDVARVKLASDRVVFLSSLEPAKVEETPLIGTQPPFPWRKDLAANGGPLKLGGRTYKKGLGMFSRSALEFDAAGRYKTFSALVGLDDSAGADCGVTFRVLADAKELYKKDFSHSTKPENIVLPLGGVRRLRLEVDYGPDGVDFGDYADWADVRVTK